MRTRCEEYFLKLFQSATLRGAVETAALSELLAFGESSMPVNVFKLAARKGFTVLEDLTGPSCEEGRLVAVPGGYRVQLRRAVTDARKRFSLAHEICHSYFYKDEGEGPRHAIGILNASERSAEERICNQFASTLLMPADALRKYLRGAVIDFPASIITVLQQASTTFQVSMPALLTRIGGLELEWPACLLVCSSVKPNPKTGLHPKLRIEFSFGLGEWSNRRLWAGMPVADVKITSAVDLFDAWVSELEHARSGQFVMVGANLEHNAVPSERVEGGILMSRRLMGLWKREAAQCISSSALYAWRHGGTKPSAYVLTVVTPNANSSRPEPDSLRHSANTSAQ